MSARWGFGERMPKNGERDGEYRYSTAEAEAPVTWMAKYLRIPEGDAYGQPFRLPDWLADYTRALYGWRTQNGRRRYRRAFLAVARGNQKTSYEAAVGVRHLAGEDIATPFAIQAGTDRENAGHGFRYAASMVRQNPRLASRLQVIPSTKRILRKSGTGTFRVTSSDAQHAHGSHPTLLNRDDMQAMESEFYDVLSTSQRTVADPLALDCMTAGFDRRMVGHREWEVAEKVKRDPSLNPALLVGIWTLGDEWSKLDLEDPDTWKRANPNLGITVHWDALLSEVREARINPSKLNTILTLHGNLWVQQRTRWLSLEMWDASAGIVDEETFRGRHCYVAVDLASVDDVAAVAYVFPSEDGSPWQVVWDFFIPGDNVLERVRRARVPYQVWIDQGWLHATPGPSVDYDAIEHRITTRIRGWGARVSELAYDPWQAEHFAQDMRRQGVATMEVPNTCKHMNLGVKEVERLVLARALVHGGNPVARWMLDNTSILTNSAGERKPDKAKSAEKIDGIVALVMGIGRAALAQQEERRVLTAY